MIIDEAKERLWTYFGISVGMLLAILGSIDVCQIITYTLIGIFCCMLGLIILAEHSA